MTRTRGTKDLIHLPCRAPAQPLDREPPDPDRWGNRRYTFECTACGERVTVVHEGPRAGGGHLLPNEYKWRDDVEWLVDL